LALLAGSNVWPHDADQQALIEELKSCALHRATVKRAAKIAETLHFDAFVSFANILIRNFPKQATRLLKDIAEISTNGSIVYNAVEMLRESDAFTLEEELEITRKHDEDTLFELYQEMTYSALYDTGTWDDRLPKEARTFADDIEIVEIDVHELGFSGGDVVCVSARISMKLIGSSFDPDEPPAMGRFSFNVEAHLEGDGLEIDSVA